MNKPEGEFFLKGYAKESMPGSPLITIITACYNAAEYLSSAIQSIRNQKYQNIQYIVIDGASSDGTIDLLRANEDVIDYWLSEPDDGIYDAWNKGIKLSSGDWIAFLGADDIYLEGAIEGYMDLIHNSTDDLPQYISSRVRLMDDSNELCIIGSRWQWKLFRKYMNVAHVGSLHHKSLFLQYGLFNTSYKICGDYEFLLRPRTKLKAAYLNLITVNMAVGGASNSDIAVFNESERAKIETGGRNLLMTRLEKYLAVCKWYLKRHYLKKYFCDSR